MREYQITVTDLADKDFEEIFDYVGGTLQEPATALKLLERLYASLNKLSQNPARCPLSKDAYLSKQGFRTLFVEYYIVFFVIDDAAKTVIIHRVLYGKRQYRSLFGYGEQS